MKTSNELNWMDWVGFIAFMIAIVCLLRALADVMQRQYLDGLATGLAAVVAIGIALWMYRASKKS